eukprot:CAMPEP_0198283106 /NCGR_PEP_ID=MMETSP1449-20131203/2787_1 /TAXON_ID=420275 /ORGANISM="Attheya septentrionalis, Strain CCMP2084" /LENGTH=207 /DNA_ID=CAMNT_0043979609 /DNA_START=136 /DNA_END=759 /DNA_ORIENTATION=+
MSKLTDYSKFDNLDSDDDGEGASSSGDAALVGTAAPQQLQVHTRKDPITGRYVYECNGQKVYEWDQSLEEVNIYVTAPPNVKASSIMCHIKSQWLQLGLVGSNQFFLDEGTFAQVNVGESSWYLDASEGIIYIILMKAFKAEVWETVLMGSSSAGNFQQNPLLKQEMQQELMRERFQEEHPGFDFRDAKFNGDAPDPRKFMGGINKP